MTALVEAEACYCRGSVDTSHTEILLPTLSEFVSYCVLCFDFMPACVFLVSPLCSSLYVFPVLLVACLSPSSVLSLHLTCPLPSPLTSPVPHHVISVSVYIVFGVAAFLVSSFCVMSLMKLPVFPLVSSLVCFGFLIFAFWFELCFWLYFA